MEIPTSDHQTPDITSVAPTVGEPEKPTPEHQTPVIASVTPSIDGKLKKPTSEHQNPDISSVPPTVGELEKPTLDHQTDISSVPPSIDGEVPHDPAVVTEVLEQQHPEAEQKTEMSEEEVKSTLEKIASTGKFWLDWEKLKVALSCWLKKVLSEYPEAEMTDELQKEALGESYSGLVSRLDEALLSFYEGPPFTLQRLCEILVAARSIYPKLSKLAFALEKNLLVTSMLSISTEPETQVIEDAKAASEDTKIEAATEDTKIESATEDMKMVAGNDDTVKEAGNEETEKEAGNVIEAMGGDTDEIMTDVVEEAEVDDAMTIDTEPIVEPSEETMAIKKSENETPSETIDVEPSSDPMAAEEGDSRLP